MPQVMRVGDRNVAGGVILNGDPTVRVNNRPVAFYGSRVTPHPCCGAKGCPPIHCSATTTAGQSSVRVNGKLVTVSSSNDTCSHVRVSGSPNVNIGA
jgi:uncharacterized Zn-binding protein involved in type VI secretion